MLRCKVNRPIAIVVKYFDVNGNAKEKELFDFEARVFCHEFDHLSGCPFIHWKISQGEIELLSGDEWGNLESTIEFYKNRLRDSKRDDPVMFEHMLYNSDHDSFIDDALMMDFEMKTKKGSEKKLSYEDVMLIDIEKGIKKDLKMRLKRESQSYK